MKYKNIKKIVILVVCIIICLPSIFTNRDSNKVSVIENRGLVRKPSLENINDLNSEYVSQLEAYIDDNIGFKQEAILLKTGVFYAMFKKLNVPNYYVGKEQNLFYSSGMDQIRNYQGKSLLTGEEVKRLSVALDLWSEFIQMLGGDFFFMPIPDKEGVYPEYYPEGVLRVDDRSRIDCLTEKMISEEWFVDVKGALLSNKGENMLYYRNFDPTHWNMEGAWVGYKELMNKITSVNSDIEMLTENDVIITYEEGPGTLESLSSIKWMKEIMQFDDKIVSCEPVNGYKAKQDNDLPIPLKDGQIYFHYVNTHIAGKKLFVVGDSYIYSFLLPLLAESFSDVYFMSFVDTETIVEMQKEICPDVVVFEVVDRAFYYDYWVEHLEKILELDVVE